MPDLFPTRAQFHAGLRQAAQRKRAREAQQEASEARLYGYQAGIPPSSIPTDLAEELDALGQQMREEEAAESPWLHQKPTGEAQAWLKVLVKG